MGKVSIIIPCFNSERFLKETVESALRQSRAPDEIIVVDDGSTDESWNVIRGFGGQVRAVRQSNAGASAARNRGTLLASGDYIQYLDADDLLEREALARKLAVAEANGADLVYGDWRRFRDRSDGIREWGSTVARAITDVDPDLELAAFGDFWCPPAALLYRRSLVDRIGGWHADLPIIQDARFLQDAVMLGAKVVRVPEVLAFYREPRPGSLSQQGALRLKRDVLVNACEIEDRWSARGVLTARRAQCLKRLYQEMARWFFWRDASLFRLSMIRMEGIPSGQWRGWETVAARLASLLGIRLTRCLLAPARLVKSIARSVYRSC